MDDNDDTTTSATRIDSRMPSPPQALYGLGIIGAWVWFWQGANGFGEHVWAVVQGVFWPAYMVYDALRALHG
ncbi:MULTISPECIES: hypothetical protein [unclassified Nocardioides]|uniref:hypothetical protein n=1 Tax=unclassified Nocardioides TaxID=2615069 RepID=UPI0011518D09|nr:MULTISPECIES: hypothetical protein [unclassified Nocardioides]TQK71285.1 hypothetical protein FBY23_3075 [Nocardioides sp. SLBN-35]WGY04548.1 hypothetical protein QI633_12435 [Nocardioides sp. QY071]